MLIAMEHHRIVAKVRSKRNTPHSITNHSHPAASPSITRGIGKHADSAPIKKARTSVRPQQQPVHVRTSSRNILLVLRTLRETVQLRALNSERRKRRETGRPLHETAQCQVLNSESLAKSGMQGQFRETARRRVLNSETPATGTPDAPCTKQSNAQTRNVSIHANAAGDGAFHETAQRSIAKLLRNLAGDIRFDGRPHDGFANRLDHILVEH